MNIVNRYRNLVGGETDLDEVIWDAMELALDEDEDVQILDPIVSLLIVSSWKKYYPDFNKEQDPYNVVLGSFCRMMEMFKDGEGKIDFFFLINTEQSRYAIEQFNQYVRYLNQHIPTDRQLFSVIDIDDLSRYERLAKVGIKFKAIGDDLSYSNEMYSEVYRELCTRDNKLMMWFSKLIAASTDNEACQKFFSQAKKPKIINELKTNDHYYGSTFDYLSAYSNEDDSDFMLLSIPFYFIVIPLALDSGIPLVSYLGLFLLCVAPLQVIGYILLSLFKFVKRRGVKKNLKTDKELEIYKVIKGELFKYARNGQQLMDFMTKTIESTINAHEQAVVAMNKRFAS